MCKALMGDKVHIFFRRKKNTVSFVGHYAGEYVAMRHVMSPVKQKVRLIDIMCSAVIYFLYTIYSPVICRNSKYLYEKDTFSQL